MTRTRAWCLAIGAAAGVLTTGARAQVVPPAPPSQADISRARVGLPPPEAPEFDLRLQAPERTAVPRAIEEVTFTLRRVAVEGATVIAPADAERYFSDLIGRPIGIAAVRDAADRLQDFYRSRGFFLSRVFIPPQRIADGTLTVRVIEGRIGDVAVQGLDPATRRAAEAALRPLTRRNPITLPALERELLILNDRPGVTARGVLRPGSVVGASDLAVTLERAPTAVQASVANTNSDLLGPWVYAAGVTAARPFGAPGALTLAGSASGPRLAASQSLSGRYAAPIGGSGLIGSVGAIVARARPQGSLRPLDIRNELASGSVRLRYPLVRSRARSLFAEGGLAVNRARTDVLGVRLIADNSSVADIGMIFQEAGFANGATVVTANLHQALPILGASGRDAPFPSVLGFDPGFTRATASAQRVQSLGRDVSLLLFAQGQYTGSKLPTGELIAFGGPAVGRGYDPSQITGDRGLGGFVELRWRLATGIKLVPAVQPYAFADAATATSIRSDFAPRSTQRLASGGVGVRLFAPFATLDLSVAKAFRQLAASDGRGDPRVLLQVSFAR